MRNKFSKIALAAIFGIALAFVFSCSSDDGDDSPQVVVPNTYFYSQYGIPINSICCTDDGSDDGSDDDGRPLSDYTFDEIIEMMTGVLRECSGTLLGTLSNITESQLNTTLAQSGRPPASRNEFISDLNRRGNNIMFKDMRNNQNPFYQQNYCAIVEYFEKE